MMRMSTILCGALATLFLGLPACDSGGGGGEGPAVVLDGVRALRIATDAQVFGAGMTLQFTATVERDDGSTEVVTDRVTWASSDTAIAVFDENAPGSLMAIAPGSVQITAAFENVQSDALTIEVQEGVVEPQLTGLVFTGGDAELRPAQTTQLQIGAQYNDGREEDVTGEAVWASSDEHVVTVEAGLITAMHTGAATISVEYGEARATYDITVVCDYPAFASNVAFGATIPPLRWSGAYRPDGTQFEFGLDEFHCSAAWDDKAVLIMVIGAGWCSPCTQFTTQIMAPQIEQLIDEGAEVLFVEAQDYNYAPATSDFAYQHLSRLIGQKPGIRVGDADTLAGDRAAPAWIQNSPLVTAFPTIWVVRRSDMHIIMAVEGGAPWPFHDIIASPDADWSDVQPELPPFRANCGPDQEEPTEPNDTVDDAGVIQPGEFDGGICAEPASDFYRIGIQGPWRITIDFDSSIADLDMFLWDKATNEPVRDERNQPIGSNGTGSREQFSANGPGMVHVFGYNNSSAPYHLTLEAL